MSVVFTIEAVGRIKPRATKALFRFGQHRDVKKDVRHNRREGRRELRNRDW